MKKIFVLAILALIAIQLYFRLTDRDDRYAPYSVFKRKMDIAQLLQYRDPTFGYTILCPDFFEEEDTASSNSYQGYARFSYTDHANVILESYVTRAPNADLQDCADSLAQLLHAHKTMINGKDSAFILSGAVYENGVRIDGYSHYGKYIKSGRSLFVYTLTYPNEYKEALSRLFAPIKQWKVLGAYH